jgi:hypothetical protein
MNRRTFIQILGAAMGAGASGVAMATPVARVAPPAPVASPQFLEVARVVSISGPSIQSDLIDVTSYDSAVPTYIPGYAQWGVMKFHFYGLPPEGVSEWVWNRPDQILPVVIDFADAEGALRFRVKPMSLETTYQSQWSDPRFTLGLLPTGDLESVASPRTRRRYSSDPADSRVRVWIGAIPMPEMGA